MEKDFDAYKLILWGTGFFARKYYLFIEEVIDKSNIEILGFCDSAPEKKGTNFYGHKIYLPEEIGCLNYDKLIIFVDPYTAPEIMRQAVENMHIDRENIGSISDIIKLVQKHQRECVTKVQNRSPKIYDCMPFFKEIDILKIRMKLLDPYVDHFVIVEMKKTHRGEDKPLNFEIHKEEFAEYQNKIIYITPDNIPQYTGKNEKEYMNFFDGSDWTLENFQRNCISEGVIDAEPEDLICISDCDEIINPIYLKEYKERFYDYLQPIWMRALDETAISLNQEYFYYFFNCRLNHRQNTSLFVKYKNLIEVQHLRHMINYLPSLPKGGWHLTYFGTLELICDKTDAIVEGRKVSKEELKFRMKNAIDPYGREGEDFEMSFIPREEIDIPLIDELINEYPQFFNKEAVK